MTDLRNPANFPILEQTILGQLAELERKQREIAAEIDTLHRMLLKARFQNELIKRTDVTRKNSVIRILIENSVLQSLGETGRVRGTTSLYRDARLIVGTLRENTFRTILHRMKKRELITSTGHGKWQIGPKQPQ
jgi:hypothetical protein